MKNFILKLVLLLGAVFTGYAQRQAAPLIQQVAEKYQQAEAYEIQTTYRMFRGFSGNQVTESYTGSVSKRGDFVRFSMLETEIVQEGSTQLIIDHATRQMVHATVSEKAIASNPVNIVQYLKVFDKRSVYEKNGMLVCELAGSQLSPDMPYGKVVFYIEKAHYRIQKQVLYFSQMIPFVDGTSKERQLDVGRLEIDFSYDAVDDARHRRLNDYVTGSSDRDLSPATTYSTYQLIKQAN
ncbi:MAG: hypothetical protein AAGA66_00515 [Bacteroidota bacterium]